MSRMLVTYEWEYAEMDKYGDIATLDYSDPGDLCVPRGMTLLALVKNYGNEQEGIEDRAWAYVEYGALPKEFSDGTRVPAKLAAEFARVLSQSYAGGAE